jgi:hypothetical protein
VSHEIVLVETATAFKILLLPLLSKINLGGRLRVFVTVVFRLSLNLLLGHVLSQKSQQRSIAFPHVSYSVDTLDENDLFPSL